MRKQFDIKYRPQIESGEYKVVVEYDNRTFNARIVCWDFNSTELLACVNYGDREDVLEYDSSGKHIGKSIRRPDLFIITPEPELSEFENKLRVICEDAVRESQLFPERTSEDFAKKHSAELLELARKEIMDGWIHGLRDTQDSSGKAYNDGYQLGFELGKAEALNDLPMWRKRDDFDYPTQFCGVVISGGQTTTLPVVIADGYEIPISELLNKLPKED